MTSLIDSFATTADQERLREKALRNLDALRQAGIQAPNARGVISGIWMRSLSTVRGVGASKTELQLDITRGASIDSNAFTAELAEIVDNSFNIHTIEVGQKRYCFKAGGEPPYPSSKRGHGTTATSSRISQPRLACCPFAAIRSSCGRRWSISSAHRRRFRAAVPGHHPRSELGTRPLGPTCPSRIAREVGSAGASGTA